jgi:hypothetical protein
LSLEGYLIVVFFFIVPVITPTAYLRPRLPYALVVAP